MRYTDGPWYAVESRTDKSIKIFIDGTDIAEIKRRWYPQYERDLANRIVACVNACRGFHTSELEGANLRKDCIASPAEIIMLKRDWDAVFGALKGVIEQIDRERYRGIVHEQSDAVDKARAIIAEIEG